MLGLLDLLPSIANILVMLEMPPEVSSLFSTLKFLPYSHPRGTRWIYLPLPQSRFVAQGGFPASISSTMCDRTAEFWPVEYEQK
jgi:hypothetical protein